MAAAPCLDAHAVQRIRLDVVGAVQGVGFRPFVYRLATEEGLAGFVRNTGAGVTLEVEGCAEALERFQVRLRGDIRPPARIQRLDRCSLEPVRQGGFAIQSSDADGAPSACVLPDLAMCEECRAEVFDPANRRYRYPFTTCTHCGPRYSIIEGIPYDRARTVMRHFAMCPACRAEYTDPASRRFHAETNACPDCGPQLALCDAGRNVLSTRGDALEGAATALSEGRIVALKGLGGFQLLVDARNEAAVARLRERKRRLAKPFAVMAGSIDQALAIAYVSEQEREALMSSAAPIVLLRARGDSPGQLAPGIAPGNPNIGLMQPATPLHGLLLEALGFPVVATSGNRSGEPMAADDAEAFARLAGIADLFLTHDRPIVNPADDSVMRRIAEDMTVLRCARGLAPLVLADPQQDAAVLALGGHMKNAVALGRDGEIVLGPHIGDLAYVESRTAFVHSIARMQQLYGAEAAVTACDTHPDYHTTRLAESGGAAVCAVQHHQAHILSAMAENGISGPVLGVAWDGTGFGADGTVWGGEFLEVEGSGYRRLAHFLPFRLPGGEAAVKEPRRTALGVLHGVYGSALWDSDALRPLLDFGPGEWSMLRSMIDRGVNASVTSSAGRLFDAVAAILKLCQHASFDGEAAMAVEFAAESAAGVHRLPRPVVVSDGEMRCIDWRPMLAEAADACMAGIPAGEIAAGFHHWLADAILEIAWHTGFQQVVLSGGCFQNALLTELAMARLQEAGFEVYRNIRVPPNDGGLAVGQAACAARRMNEVTG
ncbi:carbamoyltransferase HypF [Novosphingobium album (ex Hu et al. 2023)]|uniref:Carbamoyltransferase HypF n=1 Tax=Novosphingobium album (ex Hu et al. 2023) TaxID=2930093 RepID=A0ABT0AZ30_9SPHN|nr:carbamoyltransferase HypF [Novosphingobium album (ex Hu et al. 2023)]MCJ2177809.1 carbamoyltransferase HypF [Novosphingobium album (ex Hu et al. 2023)]